MNAKRRQKVLRCSKVELQDLSYRDDDDFVHYFQKYEVGGFRMLVHYQSYLMSTELFPVDADTFRFNSITSKDCISFVN